MQTTLWASPILTSLSSEHVGVGGALPEVQNGTVYMIRIHIENPTHASAEKEVNEEEYTLPKLLGSCG